MSFVVYRETLAPFPAPWAAGERVMTSGPFRLSNYQTLGNGSWQSGGFIVGGTGAIGMGFLAGSLLGNAPAKTNARAAADANPRWLPIEQGTLFMSQYGWHVHTPSVLS